MTELQFSHFVEIVSAATVVVAFGLGYIGGYLQ